jgi:hypothetical protein
MKDRKVKQVLPWSRCQWEGHRERVKEGEYGVWILYSCIKIDLLK